MLNSRYGGMLQVQTCRYVLLAGLAIMIIPLVVMCFFDDGAALSHSQAAEDNR